MSLLIVLEIALKSALISGVALALLGALKRLAAAQRAFIAHAGLALALMTPLWVLFGPRLELTGPWSRTPEPLTEAPLLSSTTPATASLPASAPVLNGETIAFAVYALIAGVLLAGLAVSLWRLLRLQRDAAVLTEPTWLCALAQAQQRMGMKQGTALLQNTMLSSPVSWGFLRPTIMVNPAILPDGAKAEAVLAHELAHVVRMDWLNLLIARLATAVLWFNPLVWLLAWQAHELREEAADDVVLRGDVARADYASLLMDFARRERAGQLAAAHGVSPSKDALKRRLTRVLDPDARRDPAAPAWALTCALAALLIAAPVAAFTPIDHAPPQAASVPAGAAAQALQEPTASTTAEDVAFRTQRGADVEARDAANTFATQAREAGLTSDLLIAMRVHGLTPAYIESIERAYPRARAMDYEGLIGFRVQGVTSEWLRGIAAAGYGDIAPDDMHGFAALGVTAQYIGELRAAGVTDATAEEIQSLRSNGVTGDYVRDLQRELGLSRRLSAHEVIAIHSLDVAHPPDPAGPPPH